MTAASMVRADLGLVDIIGAVPGFTPPNQARSSEKTHAIIAATLELLSERSSESVRMQDIADRAGCAVTAIYARFADKSVLFSAIHLLQLEECRPLLDEKMQTENFLESGVRGLALAFVDVNEFYFTKNFNFVLAQLRADTDTSYRMTAAIMDAYARRLSLVAAAILNIDIEEAVPPVKLAIHAVIAIFRDSVLGMKYFPRPSRETLAEIFVLILEKRLSR